MAIHNFSDTNTDYRKSYGWHRYSPYKLPVVIEQKLLLLFDEFSLRFGAVDFIVDNDDNHYFLEINPAGQFGMVSSPCNYPVERDVASYLLRHE
jgi:D-alanine-D-alanine ligase-like ATP-grasp enzyme